MEPELDTQKLKYSLDLDSSIEQENSRTRSRGNESAEEEVLETQELNYSIDLSNDSDIYESDDHSDSDESVPDLSSLKPYDFEPLIKDFENNVNENILEKVTVVKRIGNKSWCRCDL